MQPKPTAETVLSRPKRRRFIARPSCKCWDPHWRRRRPTSDATLRRGNGLELRPGPDFDRLGDRVGETLVAEIVHMQSIAREERPRPLRPQLLHHRKARQHRDMVADADFIDDRDEALVTGLIWTLRRELRVDQQERHPGRTRRGDAALDGRPECRLVDA